MCSLDPSTTTDLEAQINEARRAKRGRDLRRERQAFLEGLFRVREERVMLEEWAATRVQAMFRGFLARPRPPRLRPRIVLTPAEADRRLVADLQAILAAAGLPTIPGLGPDGRKAREGSDWGRGRGTVRSRGVGRGDERGRRSRKQRLFEDEMATRITKVVRGFLERMRVRPRREAWHRERGRMGAECIQRTWRDYRKRMGWHDLESGVMDSAAARIQARWRGMSCRMELDLRRKQDALWRRQTVSAVTIQSAARRRLAVARYGSGLTLVAARREREARAAIEAKRPRRRWKGGAPASAVAASSTINSYGQEILLDSVTGTISAGKGNSKTGEGSRGNSSWTATTEPSGASVEYGEHRGGGTAAVGPAITVLPLKH